MPYNLDIPGQVSVDQLRAIEAVAALVPEKGKLVEVGSLFGRSSWAWAKSVNPSVTLYCIDAWKDDDIRTMQAPHGISCGIEQFRAFTQDCPNILPMQGYSPTGFLSWTDPIDLYYEDAAHTDPILSQNLEFWTARLKPGGIICGGSYRPRFADVQHGAERLAERFGRALLRVDFFWCLLPDEPTLPGVATLAARLRELGAACDAAKRARGPSVSMGPRDPIPFLVAGVSPTVGCRLCNDGLDPWPAAPAEGGLTAALQLAAAASPEAVLAEAHVPLQRPQLEPDVPVEVDMVLPAGTLPSGLYDATFELTARDSLGQPLHRIRAGSATFEVCTGTPPSPVPSKPRSSLMDVELVWREFTSIVFAGSHGAFGHYLGAGALYYALAQLVRAQVAVCIGSGGGFVPTLLRRAQLDAQIAPSSTILVDANLPELAFGSPVQRGGWMTRDSDFLARERDIVVLPMLSADAAPLLAAEAIRIDYLHVDGDHSARGVLADLRAFAPLLTEYAVVTLHDLRMPSVQQGIAAFLADHPGWEQLGFPEIGNGTALLRRPPGLAMPPRIQTASALADPARKTAPTQEGSAAPIRDSQRRAPFEIWHYLKTPAYQTRYRLIRDHIDAAGATVVEVGGFPNTVLQVLEKARTLHAIEPYAPETYVAEFNSLAAEKGIQAFLHARSLGQVDLRIDSLAPFNLVMLDLDLSNAAGSEVEMTATLEVLWRLLTSAERIALEITQVGMSAQLWAGLLPLLPSEMTLDVTLDFSRDPVAESFFVKDRRALRRVMLFNGRHAAPEIDVAIRLRELSTSLVAARTTVEKPADPLYRLGTPIEFGRDGNAKPYLLGGWFGAEARFTWIAGAQASLAFACDDAEEAIAAAGQVHISLVLRPFIVSGKLDRQRIIVDVNGHLVASEALSRVTTLRVAVPAGVFLARHPVQLRLNVPDHARPCDLYNSKDARQLGVAVVRAQIDLAESAKLREESEKFIAEQRKLLAEERKLNRDRPLTPALAIAGLVLAITGVIGGIITIVGYVSERWGGL
jgi:hypothetical protein